MFEGIKKSINNFRKKGVRFDKVRWIFRSGQKDTQRMNDAETFYENSLYLNKAIEKRAEVLSSIKLKAVDEEGEVVEDMQELLDEPNDILSGRDFKQIIQTHYDLYGEFFVWKETKTDGSIRRLHILNPKRMEPQWGSDGTINEFKLRASDDKSGQTYDRDEIIWQHRPKDQDYKKAQSLVTPACFDALRAEIELREYQAKIARSGGRFDSVVSFDEKLTKEQLREIRQRYEKHRKEAKKSDQGTTPFIAGGDVSVDQLNHSPRELDYLESQRMVMEEIATITGVPRVILSTFEGVKFSNAEEARKTFLKETIKPLADKLTNTLTRNLEGVTIIYEDFVPENHEQKMERIKTGSETGSMTPNEVREELDLPERDEEEADKLYIHMNKVPINETPTE